jgi:hypothetical protein
MKKIILGNVIFFALLGCNYTESKIGDFDVTDVTKPQFFIDSTSAILQDHFNVSFEIKGYLDDSAMVMYRCNKPQCDPQYIDSVRKAWSIKNDPSDFSPPCEESVKYYLGKGVINIKNTHNDYYNGDTLRIDFIPKGSKNGYLRITSSVN